MRFSGVLQNIGQRFANARNVLNIETGASKKEIHSAYLKMAKEFHPDVNISKGVDAKVMSSKLIYFWCRNLR